MVNFRYRVEAWFEGFAHKICRNPVKTMVLVLGALTFMILQIPKITIDTSMEGFLHEEDPALLTYNAFRDQFGRDEVMIIAVKPPQVFHQSFLKKLKTLHEDLEENVPYLDDITSMVNARNTRGEGDDLIVEDLLEHWPETDADMDRLKQRTLSNPIYQDLLISKDGRFTTVIIKTHSYFSPENENDLLKGFDDDAPGTAPGPEKRHRYLTDHENSQVVHAIYDVLKKYRAPDFPVFVAGSPVVTHFLKQSMMRDMRKFMALAVLMVALLLYAMFRRVSGVVFPLLIVLLSLLATIGLMAMCEVPIKLPTQILPSFLLAVGVGTSVHILAIFYHRYRRNGNKEEAIAFTLGHSGLAIVMTNVTTACGLMSFSTAAIAPIADLGIFAGIGVMLAFFNTVTLLPAMLALAPLKPKNPAATGKRHSSVMDRLLHGVGAVSTEHPYTIIAVGILLMVVSCFAISNIRFSHHPLGWFPENSEIRSATEAIDQNLRGSISLEIIIDTGRENGLYEPDILNRLDKAVAYVESLEYGEVFAGKAWSLTTILKEIHQALHENRPAYYAIPNDRKLIAQEFLLFENSGSDDLEDVVDSQFSKARLTIKVPFTDAIRYGKFFNAVDTYFEAHFPQTRVTLTGMMALLFRTINNVMISMAKSYGIALGVITILMIFLIGRVRIGLLSMIPNIAPILLMLGVIGTFSLPMDLFTMLVASIAIGLAVDDTIHFMHNFRRYYEVGGDPKAAVFETLNTTGRAMLVTSVVLSLGFFIYAFATMQNLINFGLLTAFTIVMALLADYLIAPALMVVVNKKKPPTFSQGESQ